MAQEKQVWINIERQMKKYDDFSKEDYAIAKAFFKAGFNVYPESGYMFQKIEEYEDGSSNKPCIDIEDARIIYRHFLTFVSQKEHNNN